MIAGRAIGSDRVCVVLQDKNEKQFLSTILHECMHTMGIEHCISWDCIMNSGMCESIQVCPMDLRKLHEVCGFDIKIRYERLLSWFEKFKWKNEKKWCQCILNVIKEKKDEIIKEEENMYQINKKLKKQ